MNVVIPKLNTKTRKMDILIGIINDSKFNINDFTYEFYTNNPPIYQILNINIINIFSKSNKINPVLKFIRFTNNPLLSYHFKGNVYKRSPLYYNQPHYSNNEFLSHGNNDGDKLNGINIPNGTFWKSSTANYINNNQYYKWVCIKFISKIIYIKF